MEDKTEKEPKKIDNLKTKTHQTTFEGKYRELFPMTLRMKIESNSKNDANKKHTEVLKSLAVYFKHCEIYTTKGEKTKLKPNNSADFDYHKIRNKRQTFHIIVHRVVLNKIYHNIKKEQARDAAIKELMASKYETLRNQDILSVCTLYLVPRRASSRVPLGLMRASPAPKQAPLKTPQRSHRVEGRPRPRTTRQMSRHRPERRPREV